MLKSHWTLGGWQIGWTKEQKEAKSGPHVGAEGEGGVGLRQTPVLSSLTNHDRKLGFFSTLWDGKLCKVLSSWIVISKLCFFKESFWPSCGEQLLCYNCGVGVCSWNWLWGPCKKQWGLDWHGGHGETWVSLAYMCWEQWTGHTNGCREVCTESGLREDSWMYWSSKEMGVI